jgi:hypothetical protein
MRHDAPAVPTAGTTRVLRGVFSTRRLVMVVAVAVAAVAVVAVGQYGRRHEQAATERGIERVRAAIGSLGRPGPSDYTLANPGRSCLLWAVNGRIYALQLCIDAQGRVIEAVDRRGWTAKFYSFTDEPSAAKLRISPKLFDALLARAEERAG